MSRFARKVKRAQLKSQTAGEFFLQVDTTIKSRKPHKDRLAVKKKRRAVEHQTRKAKR